MKTIAEKMREKNTLLTGSGNSRTITPIEDLILITDAISIADEHATEMCKKQREICAEKAECWIDKKDGCPKIFKHSILSAPAPSQQEGEG